jgi:type 1 glutamine amidotransferase
MESSSDRLPEETHSLFVTKTDGKTYSPEEMEFLKGFDELVQKGMGLVIYHYATWIDNEAGHNMLLRWFGGVRQAPQSTNPVDDWANAPAPGSENHPILQGVKPWNYREEVFCKFFFPPDVKTIPLIVATPTRSTIGPQVSAWAYERPGGGRSVTIGGMDWHNLLQMEDNRKYMLNSIIWAAGMAVPEGGVQSTIPADM